MIGEEIEDGGSGVEEEGEFIGEEGGGSFEEIAEGESVDPLADEQPGARVEGDGMGDLRVGEALAKAESGGEGEAFGGFAGATEAEESDVDEAAEGEVASGERELGVGVCGEGEEAVIDEFGKRRRHGGGGLIDEILGDGHASADAEGAWGDFEAGDGLGAFEFILDDAFDDPADDFFGEAEVDDLLNGELIFDEGLEDGIEDGVRGERIVIALEGFEFCAGGFGDGVFGDDFLVAIDVVGELIDGGFWDIAEDGEAAAHIAVESAVADGEFAFIARGEEEMAEFIGEGHEGEATDAGLEIFFGGVFWEALEEGLELGFEGIEAGLDGDGFAADLEIFGEEQGIGDAAWGAKLGGHGDAEDILVAEGVGEDAGGEAFGAIGDEVEEDAGGDGGWPIWERVFEAEASGDDGGRFPGERAEGDGVEVVIDEVAEEEAAPEDFFDEGDDDDEAEEADGEIEVEGPGWGGGGAAEEIGVKAIEPRGSVEPLLWGDPEDEGEDADGGGEEDAARGTEGISGPEAEEEEAADEGLEGDDPVDGVGDDPVGVG